MLKDNRREFLGWLLAAALLAVIVLGYLMPLTGYLTATPGDLADTRFNSVVLEHLYRIVTGRHAGLWDPGFFYPFRGVLAFSESNLGSGATYVLARLLGLSREQALNAWFITGTLLNFASALYVLRRFGVSTAGAALGAFFFAFAVPVPAQDTHLQLVHRFAAPLAVLAFWRMFERRRLAELARVAFFTVWQFYCSMYLGLFLAYLLAALGVAILVVRRPFGWPRWRANLATEPLPAMLAAVGLMLLSALAFAYLAGNYYSTSRTYLFWRPVADITEMLPRAGSYLVADNSPLLAWLGRSVSVPARGEHQMFIGFGALALILAAVVWRRSAAMHGLTQAMLIALALLIVGTLWINGMSFYYLVVGLPGIEVVRAVSRIILIMLVPMSVLVALGADAVCQRLGRTLPAKVTVLAGLAALLAVEPLTVGTYSTPIAQWRSRLDVVKALLPPDLPKDAILLVRTSATDIVEQYLTELDAMLIGQDLGYPVLNGYSGFFPQGYKLQPCAPVRARLIGFTRETGGIGMSAASRRLVVVDRGTCPAQ